MPTTAPIGAGNDKGKEADAVTYTIENLSLAKVARDRHFAEFNWNQDPAVVSLAASAAASASIFDGDLSELTDSEDEADIR